MKRKKYLFGWLLLAIPAAVQAQFTYTVANQTVTITGYTGTSLVVAIPRTINGLPVTSLGAFAFSGRSITSVTIPDSLTSIGYNAFWECTRLTSVTIPNSVTNIGDFAFYYCSSLANLTLGGAVTSIGDYAFLLCTSLSSVTIPSSVTSIRHGAFSSCTNLTNIMVDPLNSAYRSVDGVLFDRTETALVTYPAGKFGSYTVPNSATSIGDFAFSGCISLSSVTIPD